MKITKIVLILIALSLLLSGCVDYDKLVQEQNDLHKEELTEDSKAEVLLGDINNDGKEEKLLIQKTILKLYSGARICEKFNLSTEYIYSDAMAYVSDIDGDDENEIIAMLYCDTRETNSVLNVVIIDNNENGEYELWDFPEEITSNYADSGFGAEVTIKDKYIYSVSRDSYKFDVDVSRMYGLSMLDKEGLGKAEEQWAKIEKSNYFGGVLGIYKINILSIVDGNKILNIYEYVTGGDDKIIGSLVFSIVYNKDGKYEIKSIMYEELSN